MRRLGSRHGNSAANMGRIGEFSPELATGPPPACPCRITRLGHEILDHAMELHAIIKPFACQFLDPGDMSGRKVGPHLDHHPSVLQIKVKRVFRIRGERVFHRQAGHADQRENQKHSGQKLRNHSLPLLLTVKASFFCHLEATTSIFKTQMWQITANSAPAQKKRNGCLTIC